MGVVIDGTNTTGNLVKGNFIGTDANGTASVGNFLHGVVITESPGNTIGGTTGTTAGGACTGACNLISGNNFPGVLIFGPGSTGNILEGNFIGTDVNGTANLGNAFFGVGINGGTDNTVGGTATGAGNLISGNTGRGVAIVATGSTGNKVQGNFIGTQTDGTSALANTEQGVFLGNPIDVGDTADLGSSSDNFVGGTASGAGNTIAFNGEDGVFVGSGTGQVVLGNSIFSNTGLGIDIGADGVTSNDAGDADTGANNLQNFPVLQSVQIAPGGALFVEYFVDSAFVNAANPLVVEFFIADADTEEGKTFLGTDKLSGLTTVLTNLGSAASLGVSSGDSIVATATDAANNTSEFSQSVSVTSSATAIPSLSQWGLVALAVLMSALIAWRLRRRTMTAQA